MYKILLFSIISFVFLGCTNKNSAFRYFEDSKVQTNLVQNTKKIDILINEKPEVLFWGTYLNKLEKFKNLENENFLVTIYFTSAQTQDFKENSYNLLLNNKKSVSIEKIDSTNEKYKAFLINNKWANSYVVKFKKIEETSMILNLTNDVNGAQLEFEK